MKKMSIMCSVLIILMLQITACGKDNSIEITMDNYEKYLEIDVVLDTERSTNGFDTELYINGYHGECTLYPEICAIINTNGVSTNYDYSEISVELELKGPYYVYDKNSVEEGISVRNSTYGETNVIELVAEDITDIAGNAEYVCTYKLGDDEVTDNNNIADLYCEIVGISGKVTPVR